MRIAVVVPYLAVCLAVSPLAGQSNGNGPNGSGPPGQAGKGWLANQGNLIQPGDLPPHLERSLQFSGSRMMSADKAQISFTGAITDAQGTRNAQVTIQAPGYLIYRESQGHAVGYDGTGLKGNSGALSQSDQAIMESILAQFPDMVCLQVATGGSYRRVGSHFRANGTTGGTYTGPYWTLLAFSPSARTGLAQGAALQQQMFIAVDENTGFISEVRVTENQGSHQTVTQTQFSNWVQQADQWYPSNIVRLENGKQVLSFQMQAVTIGPAGPTAAFIP